MIFLDNFNNRMIENTIVQFAEVSNSNYISSENRNSVIYNDYLYELCIENVENVDISYGNFFYYIYIFISTGEVLDVIS